MKDAGLVEFVTPAVFKTGTVKSRRSSKATTEKKQKLRRLPVHLRGFSIRAEPAVDTPECEVDVYRAHCPAEDCGHISGKYVSERSARLALYGHFRWRHKWLA